MDYFNAETLLTTTSLVALLTLFVLEIVLGIDNVIFLTILADKLPPAEAARARRLGISGAVLGRVLLLLAISFVIQLDENTIVLNLTGRDLILLAGGLFLIAKSTYEIHHKLEDLDEQAPTTGKAVVTLGAVVVQVLLIDLVFSLDSVITAIGITDQFPVMVVAIIAAAGVMLFFAEAIGDFVKRHPTMKILALSFLILIGALLVVEGWAHEAAEELQLKNYIYFAMAFSFLVELVNMRFRRAPDPVQLHNQPTMPKKEAGA